MTTGKTIALTRQTFVGKVMSLLFIMLSRLAITSLPRSKHLLISWWQSPSAVILEPKKIKSVTVSIVSPIYWPWSDCYLSKWPLILGCFNDPAHAPLHSLPWRSSHPIGYLTFSHLSGAGSLPWTSGPLPTLNPFSGGNRVFLAGGQLLVRGPWILQPLWQI